MANDNRPKLRLIKAVAIPRACSSRSLILGNQFFPAIPSSCELLPKLRFMRVEGSVKLCICYPGQRAFQPVIFARDPAKAFISPVVVNKPMDANESNANGAWPHKHQIDLQSLDARSLRGIAELAYEPAVLPPEVEEIIGHAFRAGWLDQCATKRSVWGNVRAKCKEVGVKSPSYQAVATRIDCLFSREVLRFHPLTRDGSSEKPGGYPPD